MYIVTPGEIAALHRDFLNDPTPTDVITFEHGEIFVCAGVAARQRKASGLSLHDEVLTYILHGLLHLCGLDDHTPAEFDTMAREQEKLLQAVLSA